MNKYLSKTIVGNKEWCAFPELGIPAIKARVDSGAKTSSLHAFNIRPFKKQKQMWVDFKVHPLQNNKHLVLHCKMPVVDHRAVKSSNGISTLRYVIKTPLKLNDRVWDIELTLTNRDAMGYRMLLGREAMHHLLISPLESFCLGRFSISNIRKLYEK